ncbi:hypothetical protein PAXINDRAFT_102280 [Paxillus involutus ATCC 200175]|uniref:DNA 3'-5' helicase n=1 Tax=Paxillus involutus ATCC 200175 TaxID=664439 RepID=A0A0C9T0T0_PAXIN|nr:hypothetical protein PAXINDRAFT_102280 [Paxillus involutus ATCC 200175]
MDSVNFMFNSPAGLLLCREILKDLMPPDTHDWQLQAITWLLDGEDVLLITATGSGKTDVFIRLMRLIKYFTTRPRRLEGVRFPSDPGMIVVCPTKALEEEMEKRMLAAGLSAVAINGDHVDAARQNGQDLFKQANDPKFNQRVCMMAVDEAHLLNSWGETFRKDYQQTGWLRARFDRWLPLLAVTATMQDGVHTKKVCDFLGFKDGQYCIIRRSNMRHDIQLIFRTLHSGVHGIQFHDLDWILKQRTRTTLIFCGTIDFSF